MSYRKVKINSTIFIHERGKDIIRPEKDILRLFSVLLQDSLLPLCIIQAKHETHASHFSYLKIRFCDLCNLSLQMVITQSFCGI